MKFDNHIHTSYSPCCLMHPADVVLEAERKGLDSIVIADHNTCRGALAALRSNTKARKVIVEIGIEISTHFGEIGLKYLHPDECHRFESAKRSQRHYDFEEIIHLVQAAKKNPDTRLLVDLHHPFSHGPFGSRKGVDLEELIAKGIFQNERQIADFFDCVELNGANLSLKESIGAISLGKRFGLPVVCSSDAHFRSQIGRYYTEGYGRDIIASIKSNQLNIPGPHDIDYKMAAVYRTGSKLIKTIRPFLALYLQKSASRSNGVERAT